MKIQFCGASTSVTGSCHLITTDNFKILLLLYVVSALCGVGIQLI